MSKRRRNQEPADGVAHADVRAIRRTWLIIGFSSLALAVLVIYWIPGSPHREPMTADSPAAAGKAAQVAEDTPVDPQKLLGKWQRAGEQYMLEIRTVSDDGTVEAAYFNPRPIHVGQARFDKAARPAKIVVELRDTNYPGSTYTLHYDRQRDLLSGTYFQPASNQTFPVDFVRLP